MSHELARRIRVLVVDGDAVVREGLTRLLGGEAGIEVVGAAWNGRTAALRVASQRPDLVVVDLVQPAAATHAVEFLQDLQRSGSPIQKVVIAAEGSPTDVLQRCGVVEVVRRAPGAVGEAQLGMLARDLLPPLLRLGARVGLRPGAPVTPAISACPLPRQRRSGCPPLVVGIGVSTGGPKALAELLPRLPADFPLPVVVVQHMPPKFTRSLAESLDRLCSLRVHEAREGDRVERGKVLVAPGGVHLRVARAADGEVVNLTLDPPECSCRPAVDYLFRSLQQTYGGRVLGVVLTGMGEDGWAGARLLHTSGGCVLAQDEASSAVFGMPRGPIQAGIATAVSLDSMADAIQLAARGNSCS